MIWDCLVGESSKSAWSGQGKEEEELTRDRTSARSVPNSVVRSAMSWIRFRNRFLMPSRLALKSRSAVSMAGYARSGRVRMAKDEEGTYRGRWRASGRGEEGGGRGRRRRGITKDNWCRGRAAEHGGRRLGTAATRRGLDDAAAAARSGLDDRFAGSHELRSGSGVKEEVCLERGRESERVGARKQPSDIYIPWPEGLMRTIRRMCPLPTTWRFGEVRVAFTPVQKRPIEGAEGTERTTRRQLPFWK
jgi:hypothetical protein